MKVYINKIKKKFLHLPMTFIFSIDLCLLIIIQVLLFKIYIIQFIIFDFFFFISLYALKIYCFEKMETLAELLLSTVISATIALICSLIVLLLIFNFPKKAMFINCIISIILTTLLNKALYIVYMKYAPKEKYLVLSKNESINQYIKEAASIPYKKVEIVSFTNPSPSLIAEACEQNWTIILADQDLIKRKFKEIQKRKINYIFLPEFIERELKRIPIEVVDAFKEYYEISLSIISNSTINRLLDIVLSLICLIIASPLLLVISLMIYFEDGVPILFRQKRIGKNQDIITIHKLRSMDKNENKDTLFASSEENRLTKVGRIIRKFRLDEFPQFWDVLIGKMSIVGPRPEQIAFVERFNNEIPYYFYRHNIKPGITGWAQINYDYSETIEEVKKKLSYDLWYVKHKNTLLDLQIILQTIEIMLFKRGAR